MIQLGYQSKKKQNYYSIRTIKIRKSIYGGLVMLSYDLRNAILKTIEDKGYIKSDLLKTDAIYDITKNISIDVVNDNYEAVLFTMILSLLDYIYYDDGIVVTAINSNPVFLKIEVYKNLKQIILYHFSHKNNEYMLLIGFLIEFVLLYNLSLNNEVYMSTPDYDKFRQDFYSVFSKEFIYTSLVNEITQYYDRIIEFLKHEESKIDDGFLYRFFQVINKYNISKKQIREYIRVMQYRTSFLDVIIDNVDSKYLSMVTKFINEHLIDNMSKGNSRDIELIQKLKSKTKLLDEIQKGYVNSLVKRTNLLLTEKSPRGVIMDIHNFEVLLTDLGTLKQAVDDKYKSKINECQQKILYMKRKLVSDEDEIYKDMQKLKFEGSYDNDLVERTRKALMKDPLFIYSIARVDYHKELENALINKSKYAISYLVSEISIDSKNGVYQYHKEYDDIFSKYFDQVGKVIQTKLYTEDKHKPKKDRILLNYYEKGFYDAMLKDLSTIYSFTFQSLCYMIDMKKYLHLCREKLNKLFGTDNFLDELYDDLSFFLPELVLAVEYRLLCIYNQENDVNVSRIDELKYLSYLFEKTNSEHLKNDIFYLYYLLYCERGFDLRNRIFHGQIQIGEYYMYTFLLMACFNCILNIEESKNVKK